MSLNRRIARGITLALVILFGGCMASAFMGCATTPRGPTADDLGYVVEITNRHPDAVVVYLMPEGRRLGRVAGAFGGARYWLSTSRVEMGAYFVVCVGSRSPMNRRCSKTVPMSGGYAPYRGQPGKVFLMVQRGPDGIFAWVNG